MKLLKSTFVFLTLCPIVALAGEKTFFYRTHLNVSELSCEAEATLLADRFVLATGLKVSDVACGGTTTDQDSKDKFYAVTLSYQASQEVKPYEMSVSADYFGMPNGNQGVYDSLKACRASLAARLEDFKAQTGLVPVHSLCLKGKPIFDSKYMMSVKGMSKKPIVKPAKQLFAFAPSFINTSGGSVFLDQVEGLIRSSGGAGLFRIDSTFFYFAEYMLPLGKNTIGSFSVAEECHSQVLDVEQALAAALSKNYLVKCMTGGEKSSVTYLNMISDRGVLFPNSHRSLETYYSFEECRQDRARAQQVLGVLTTGAVCLPSYSNSQYEMMIFLK